MHYRPSICTHIRANACMCMISSSIDVKVEPSMKMHVLTHSAFSIRRCMEIHGVRCEWQHMMVHTQLTLTQTREALAQLLIQVHTSR